MENDANPMSAANSAPRCTARSKRTGQRCRGPAVRGWAVCRFHGAGGGQPAGMENAAWKHGIRSKAHTADRKAISDLQRQLKELGGVLD
jgi:hypothetical protein